MPKLITVTQAQECLDIVRAQFADHIDPDANDDDGPVLFEPGFYSEVWTIGWDCPPATWWATVLREDGFRPPYGVIAVQAGAFVSWHVDLCRAPSYRGKLHELEDVIVEFGIDIDPEDAGNTHV